MTANSLTPPGDDSQAEIDVAEWVHRAGVHSYGPCDGKSDGCEGGPTQSDYEFGEEVIAYLRQTWSAVLRDRG
jgi:hypothetical protein